MRHANDSAATAEQREKNKLAELQLLTDVKALLNTPEGMRFFKWLLDKAYLFKTTFTGNSRTYFLEGHRNLGIMVFNLLMKAAPQKLIELAEPKKEENHG